jgi:dihydroflavonol-4-reductase
MTQKKLALVSGADGHLGNNLVRLLVEKGIAVRATVRNLNSGLLLTGLGCEVLEADITDK